MKKTHGAHTQANGWQRLLMSFLCVVILNGLFLLAVHMKSRRTSPALLPSTEEEDTLNVWAMDSSDKRLTPEAADFLNWANLLEHPEPDINLLNLPESSDTLLSVSPEIKKQARNQTSKRRFEADISLDWHEITAQLDSFLPKLPLLPLQALNYQRLLASSGLLARDFDLKANSLDNTLGIGRHMARHNSFAGVLRPTPWPESPVVLVNKYENSAWESVPADDLARQGAAILSSNTKKPEDSDISDLYEIHVDIITGHLRCPRVHLRQSSGIPELDDMVIAWVQKQHASSGHHHTDAPLIASSGHLVEYLVEFTRGPLR
ncbi:MAG: hypothetical protein J6X55_04750 [Victivallales bacterium]|nr:hypothetical protein [Victivallales bacterium]